ncbi:hypothetical protein CBR_g17634 [Chara braunii]|uniref:Integrase catalytic domain-containing protein n=1 Tax=Chara braunii TaxID=69332 RepID=A0A388KV40_CHABU|nr:hypothetical protein CBR_g17634 [Chara braunii]|eukprot:GBG73919.1 hypothetical protein CBR_g17634 [Chara braunii]
MQDTLDQILQALHKPGIRPATLPSLPLSAMAGLYAAQSGPPPSVSSTVALSQTIASSSSGPTTVATPQSPPVSQPRQQYPWYPKTPLNPPATFSGDKKDEALDTWLRTVPVWVRAKRTLVEEEVITAASYLEGSAARWLNGLVASKGFGRNMHDWAQTYTLESFMDLVEARWHNPQQAQIATDGLLKLDTRKYKSVQELTTTVERLIVVPGVEYNPQVLLTMFLRCLPTDIRNLLASEARRGYHTFESFSKKALDLEARLGGAQTPSTDGRKKKHPQEWKKKGSRLMMVDSDGNQTEIDDVSGLVEGSEFDGEERLRVATSPPAGSAGREEVETDRVHEQKDAFKEVGTKSTYERELYALYKALVHWRHYLLGRFFYLRTDHQTLKWIKTQPVLSDALKRWIDVIDQYDFKLYYLKGEYNKVADALSRRADYLGALISEFDLSEDVTRSLDEAYKEDPITMDIINKLQSKDKATTDEFVMVDGLLFLEKAGFKRLVVPSRETLRSLFLGECHDATGHFGYKKTSANLVQRFWWPNMLDDVKKYVETCQVCQRDKPRTRAPLGLLKPLPIPAGPGQSISMDFMDTLVTSKNGKRHIFVIVDRFTKYARLITMPETASTEHVIKLFMDSWAEQMNRVVQHLLRHYIKPSQDDWDEKLPLIASLYNNAVHNTIGVSPNQLHLGWKPRSALDFLLPENRTAATPGTIEFGVQYEKLLQQTVEHIKKSQEAMIASENKRRRQSTFQVGERVWVKASELGQEFGISRKLMPQYFSPWEVLDIVGNDLDSPSYVIRIPGHLRTYPVFHASKLAPFAETAQFPSRRSMLPPTMDGHVDVDDILDHRDTPVPKPPGRGRPPKPAREYRVVFYSKDGGNQQQFDYSGDECHVSSATSQCQISSATSAVPHQQCQVTVPRQTQCHVSSDVRHSTTSAVPQQQCHVSNMTDLPGQLPNESLAAYKQRFHAQIEAEEQRQLAAEAARAQAEEAAAVEQLRLQADADADAQARRKEAQDLLQRHEANSIDRLKFWHFEPNGDEATPEEKHKEFLSKLVTRLLYACNYQRSELERQYQDLTQQHEELAKLRRIAVPGPAAGASSSAPSSRQLEDRVDHVVAMLGDISTFAAPTTTISSQLHTLKTEVQQLQSTNADDNPKMYKMPTFNLERFDDYTQQDPVLWWEAFTTQLRILPVAKHAYIGALFLNSKGGCQTWLSHLATSHGADVPDLKDKITWEELTRLWKKRFIVDDAPALAINRLFTMSQGNTATRDWLTEWQKIAAVPNLNLPFEHLRREFYNRSCAALSQALGDREQYSTFAEIIDKAREIIKTNRSTAHEKSTSWQPTYVEKVRTGPRQQHFAAVQQDSGDNRAATPVSSDGDQVAAVQPRSTNKSRNNGKAKSASQAGNGQPRQFPWVKFGLTEAEYKVRGRYGSCYWCNNTKHKTSLCQDQGKEDVRPRLNSRN